LNSQQVKNKSMSVFISVHLSGHRLDGNKEKFDSRRRSIVVLVVSIDITHEEEFVRADVVGDDSRRLASIRVDVLCLQFFGAWVE